MFEGQRNFEIRTRKPKSPTLSGLVKVRIADYLGEGAEGRVNRAKVTLSRNDKSRSTQLAFKSSHDRRNSNDDLIFNYKNAKRAGLPVPKTFRSTENRIDILLTDLTEGGKNIVLSPHDLIFEIKSMKTLYHERPEQMTRFANAEPLASETTGQKFKEFAEKGGNARMRLSIDAWFIVIKPDGTYDFILGDFRSTPKKYGILQEKQTEENFEYLKTIKELLSTLQDYAREPITAMERLESISQSWFNRFNQ